MSTFFRDDISGAIILAMYKLHLQAQQMPEEQTEEINDLPENLASITLQEEPSYQRLTIHEGAKARPEIKYPKQSEESLFKVQQERTHAYNSSFWNHISSLRETIWFLWNFLAKSGTTLARSFILPLKVFINKAKNGLGGIFNKKSSLDELSTGKVQSASLTSDSETWDSETPDSETWEHEPLDSKFSDSENLDNKISERETSDSRNLVDEERNRALTLARAEKRKDPYGEVVKLVDLEKQAVTFNLSDDENNATLPPGFDRAAARGQERPEIGPKIDNGEGSSKTPAHNNTYHLWDCIIDRGFKCLESEGGSASESIGDGRECEGPVLWDDSDGLEFL